MTPTASNLAPVTKYIHRLQPGGKSIKFEQRAHRKIFTKTVGNDSFVLEESDAGIYLTVRMFRDDIECVEKLYGMSISDDVFHLYHRDWGGKGYNKSVRYLREEQYPVGKQVRLKCTSNRATRNSSQSLSTPCNSSTTASGGNFSAYG